MVAYTGIKLEILGSDPITVTLANHLNCFRSINGGICVSYN